MEVVNSSYSIGESAVVLSSTGLLPTKYKKVADLKEKESIITITVSRDEVGVLLDQIHFRNHISYTKDKYCLIAINNLIKKNEFLQLSLQLSENVISEEEFETELENFPDKYLIRLNNLDNPEDISIISDLVNRIGRKFNVDDVSELFSIDTRALTEEVNQINNK